MEIESQLCSKSKSEIAIEVNSSYSVSVSWLQTLVDLVLNTYLYKAEAHCLSKSETKEGRV